MTVQHDDRPAHDDARREAELMLLLQGVKPVEPRYVTWGNLVVIVVGFALAWGLALLVLAP